ncbi:MAG TPA: hypothetical protein VI318_17970, partial [Baekduia sp.]
SRRRRTVAAGRVHAVRRAHRPAPSLTPEIPVARDAVLAGADRLLALAGVLRSERPVPDAGVAAARHLLTDGAGPLYLGGPGELADAITVVEVALDLR